MLCCRLQMVHSTNIVRKNMMTKSLRSPNERRKKRFWRKVRPPLITLRNILRGRLLRACCHLFF
jgi:hypothetical protein